MSSRTNSSYRKYFGFLRYCRTAISVTHRDLFKSNMPPLRVEQLGTVPFEVFTVDGLFDDEQVAQWKRDVSSADPSNRPFTQSAFKNGKSIAPDVTQRMQERLWPILPEAYTDAQGRSWTFAGVTKYVMYAEMQPGQGFPIHTDTGAEFSDEAESKFTVLIYLNHDFEGGATQFYDSRFRPTFAVSPHAGRALVFDIDLFHAGTAVTSGAPKLWIGTELVCSIKPKHTE